MRFISVVYAEADTTTNAPEPARLHISGFGLLGNRTLRNAVREVQSNKRAPTFDTGFIEDTLLILHNRVVEDGYLDASVSAKLALTNGATRTLQWDGKEELTVPVDLQVHEAWFEVHRGTLFFYDHLTIAGLTALPEEEAKAYFVVKDVLLQTKHSRRFSPHRLHRSMGNLQQELKHLGYRDAEVNQAETTMNHDTGAVDVRVQVKQGPQYFVQSLRVQAPEGIPTNNVPLPSFSKDQPYSMIWQQDAAQFINRHFFALGYPDSKTRIEASARTTNSAGVHVALVAKVTPGKQVRLGEIRFNGGEHTSKSFLRRQVRLVGPLLDRLAADRARERLARLGIFKFVDLQLEPKSGSPRDVVFDLTEGKRYDLSLIAGYGSYDQFFGGVEFNHYNLWGIGHNTKFRGVQSFKSTQITYTYTIPQFLAPDLSLFAAADGFRREELTFNREELKFSTGLRKQFPGTGHQLGLRYSYEFLNARDAAPITEYSGTNNATEAAVVIADWQLDQRDNPLVPTKGYRLYVDVEYANPAFGGDSEYTRVELAASWHHPFSRGLVLHLGLQHDMVFTPDRINSLPFNKRFFPGGENSVRGYQRGGASPLDANGNQVGAESDLVWNIELEQRLTRAFSLVGFVDGTGITPVIEHYPFDQVLWSAGGGVCWNTIIGPVRLEYGQNLNPREHDPEGTLHFSIGFPF